MSDTKTCPFCAEEVKLAAIVCKHCHKDLPIPAPLLTRPSDPTMPCPKCSETIPSSSLVCSFCKTQIAALFKDGELIKPSTSVMDQPVSPMGAVFIIGLVFVGIVFLRNPTDLGSAISVLFSGSPIGYLLLIGGLLVYFLPSLIGREKKNSMSLFLMNLFLGWTFIGWVMALVWATKRDD